VRGTEVSLEGASLKVCVGLLVFRDVAASQVESPRLVGLVLVDVQASMLSDGFVQFGLSAISIAEYLPVVSRAIFE